MGRRPISALRLRLGRSLNLRCNAREQQIASCGAPLIGSSQGLSCTGIPWKKDGGTVDPFRTEVRLKLKTFQKGFAFKINLLMFLFCETRFATPAAVRNEAAFWVGQGKRNLSFLRSSWKVVTKFRTGRVGNLLASNEKTFYIRKRLSKNTPQEVAETELLKTPKSDPFVVNTTRKRTFHCFLPMEQVNLFHNLFR